MTVYGRMLLAAAGSALLLLGALAFQYVGGLAPCPMCLWQRWPHLLAVLVGILGVTVLWRQRRWLALAGAAL
ncbi:MAG: disulfide bond formation protein B, partial [Pseudomonadota bacterium]